MWSLPIPRSDSNCSNAGLVDEVALHRVLQVELPVEANRAADVALLVRGGVFVDLDEYDARVVEVALDPRGVDEYVIAAHAVISFVVCGGLRGCP